MAGAALVCSTQGAGGASVEKALVPAQIDAIFTGEFDNGAPVYRLPTITIIAYRKAELDKTERGKAESRPLQKG